MKYKLTMEEDSTYARDPAVGCFLCQNEIENQVFYLLSYNNIYFCCHKDCFHSYPFTDIISKLEGIVNEM